MSLFIMFAVQRYFFRVWEKCKKWIGNLHLIAGYISFVHCQELYSCFSEGINSFDVLTGAVKKGKKWLPLTSLTLSNYDQWIKLTCLFNNDLMQICIDKKLTHIQQLRKTLTLFMYGFVNQCILLKIHKIHDVIIFFL